VLNWATSKRISLHVNEWVYLFTYTLHLYTIGSVGLPLHDYNYLITCTRNSLSNYLHLSGYLNTKWSVWLPLHDCIYLVTCTRNALSDYLHTSVSIWLPAHDRVYLITCIRLDQYDNLHTTVSICLPEHEMVYLITCTRQRLSDYPQMKVLADYLYTNGPISVSLGFSPWLRKPSALVTLNMYTLVSLMTPGLCQYW